MNNKALTRHIKPLKQEKKTLFIQNADVEQQHTSIKQQYTGIEQQRKLFFKLVKSSDINIVTCGNCGDIVLHKIKHEGDIHCPHCLFASERCDFPDFY
jgi:hypothetical protein